MFEPVSFKEDIEQDYEQYRHMMEESYLHGVLSGAAEYVDTYGLDVLLKNLSTYTNNPQQTLLISRCIDFVNDNMNNILRNSRGFY